MFVLFEARRTLMCDKNNERINAWAWTKKWFVVTNKSLRL